MQTCQNLVTETQNNLLSVDCQLHYDLIYHHRKALDMGSMYFSHSQENYENEKERKKKERST
jgi:hypothetical protein